VTGKDLENGKIEMLVFFRVLVIVFVIWILASSLYLLGKSRAFRDRREQSQNNRRKRKYVQSSEVKKKEEDKR
jgi:hypothetical protein